jgi:hypothetical protein
VIEVQQLACTFATSIAGAATDGLLALSTAGDIAPHWTSDCSAAPAASSAPASNHDSPNAHSASYSEASPPP